MLNHAGVCVSFTTAWKYLTVESRYLSLPVWSRTRPSTSLLLLRVESPGDEAISKITLQYILSSVVSEISLQMIMMTNDQIKTPFLEVAMNALSSAFHT